MEYEGDEVDHERVLLFPLGGGVWWIRTPDGDEYLQDVTCQDASNGPVRGSLLPADGSLPPARRGRRRRRLYRFADRLGLGELREGILRGLRACEAECRVGQRPVVPELVQALGGEVLPIARLFGGSFPPLAPGRRVRGKRPLSLPTRSEAPTPPLAAEGERALVARPLPPRAGHAWVLAEPTPSMTIGSGVDIHRVPCVEATSEDGLVFLDEGYVRVVQMRVEDMTAYAETRAAGLRQLLGAAHAGSGADLRDRLGRPPLPGSEEPPSAAEAVVPIRGEDVRLLALDFDGQGERFKPWREAVHESTQEEFSDQTLDAPPGALTTCKSMVRVGGDPRLWFREYLREKCFAITDRVARELRCIREVLYMAGCYGQVNLGGLMVLEVLCKRLAGIVVTHSNPQRAQWELAKYYKEAQSAEDVVGPLGGYRESTLAPSVGACETVPHLESHRLFRRLAEIGIASWTSTPKCQVGLFTVENDGGAAQRLIVDARRANECFKAPPGVSLPSSLGLSRVEVALPADAPLGSERAVELLSDFYLSVGLSDVSNCFHRLCVPAWLSDYFCLPLAPAHVMGAMEQQLVREDLERAVDEAQEKLHALLHAAAAARAPAPQAQERGVATRRGRRRPSREARDLRHRAQRCRGRRAGDGPPRPRRVRLRIPRRLPSEPPPRQIGFLGNRRAITVEGRRAGSAAAGHRLNGLVKR
ncbi:unnamed protein product [Prorocentrum cordatum]|uniref:Uncharacterized protein n=1 Tax=Prorocentrum cordatum TaxID=2364126 RepID=A0ABN9TIL5_9DINO|nr:unnamed protein product [Polarella glacialis]